ncbi:MAG: hypothetical protein JO006_04980 [Paucibacter sp.]|nr:hypothetical protein [Roseateles sp.]
MRKTQVPWLMLVLAVMACATPQPASREEVAARIDSLIGTAACDSDAQCRVVGIGARACGGPATYRAWSSLHTDEATLKAAADALATLDREAAARSHLMSDCRMLPRPGTVCRPVADGPRRCVLETANNAS